MVVTVPGKNVLKNMKQTSVKLHGNVVVPFLLIFLVFITNLGSQVVYQRKLLSVTVQSLKLCCPILFEILGENKEKQRKEKKQKNKEDG